MVDLGKFIAVGKTMFPRSRIAEFDPYWGDCFEYAGINTINKAAMFLGQIAVECDGFTDFEEDFNYSAVRLIQVFPKYFRLPKFETDAEVFNDGKRNALLFAKRPEKIANYVYGSRYLNGNESSGDGYRYRGRGPKQITFFDNYNRCNKATKGWIKGDIVKDPDLLLIPENGIKAAAWFWKSNNINNYAESGNSIEVTKIIQGGNAKLKERDAFFKQAKLLIA